MNHKRILSKSSLRSTPSSGKRPNSSDEVLRLQAEVNNLKRTVETLKISLENRDAAIGTLAREKEKLYVELKSVQRTNRNLHQQLIDERDIHSKEKDYFNEEIIRLSQKGGIFHVDQNQNKNEFKESLEEEIKSKDEVIYNMGVKYFKLRSNKRLLKKKLEKTLNQSQKTCKDIILLLEQNRNSLDYLLNRLITAATMTPSSSKYLELLQINANLNFENAQLKVCLTNERLLHNPSNENFHEDSNKHSDDDNPCVDNDETAKKQQNSSPAESKLLSSLQRSKRTIVNKHVSCRHFMYIHEELSPYFRSNIRGCKSEPYLACFK